MLVPGLAIALAVRSLLLPGSETDVELATARSSYILAAKYVGPGRPMASSDSGEAFSLWSRLEPVEFLKGSISADNLNRLPLSLHTKRPERFPEPGQVYLFFVSRSVNKVLHDTPANRAAIAAAPKSREAYDLRHGRPAWSGGLGGGMGPPPAVASTSMTRATYVQTLTPFQTDYSPWPEPSPPTPPPIVREQGVWIRPRPDAGAPEREFARLFETQDPRPADRLKHFAWLESDEVYRRYTVVNKGWTAKFQSVRPHPTLADAWLVTISVSPWLHANLRHSMIYDTVEETYELHAGRIRLIDSNAATPKPDRHVYPVAL